ERAVQLDPNFATAWARLSRADAQIYINPGDPTPAARLDAARRASDQAQRLEPDSPETLLALGYYQYWLSRDYGAARTTFDRVSKMFPGYSEVLLALSRVTRRQGHWDETVAYSEQALALDPRNVALLMDAALTYAELREFPAALKLYDRVLDITPNDPDAMAAKAAIYHAQGDLREAAKWVSGINEQAPSDLSFGIKVFQFELERNYGEATRLLEARLAQSRLREEKAAIQMGLAFVRRFAGDTVGAKAAAEQVRNTFEALYKQESDKVHPDVAVILSQAYAVLGEKEPALTVAEHAFTLPLAKDP